MDYIIRPNKELLRITNRYQLESWNSPHIWNLPKPPHNSDQVAEFALLKHLYLVDQIALGNDIDSSILSTLFGSPVKLNIDTFDRWWNVKLPDWSWIVSQTIDYAEPKHYNGIVTTGISVLDDWIYKQKNNIKKRRDFDYKYMSIYLREPSDKLRAILKDNPNHQWCGETLLYIPHNVLADQDKYEIELVKTMAMVEINRIRPLNTPPEIVKLMFGEPPSFNFITFDKLWSIRKIKVVGSFEVLMNKQKNDPEAVGDAFKAVELAANIRNDEWIKNIRKNQR